MATKKTTTTPKSAGVKKVSLKTEVQNQQSKTMSFAFKKSYAITLAIVILVAGVLYLNRGLFIAAIVNGKPIFRTSVITQLERQGGKQTLDSLITEELVLQEAAKQKVEVSDKEVNDEMKKIEGTITKQGQSLDSVLASQGMTKDSLKNRIRLQKLVEKMVGKDITVTDKEVDDYIEKNKENIAEESDMTKVKEGVKEQLKQQKLSEKIQTWISNLQKNAKTLYFITY